MGTTTFEYSLFEVSLHYAPNMHVQYNALNEFAFYINTECTIRNVEKDVVHSIPGVVVISCVTFMWYCTVTVKANFNKFVCLVLATYKHSCMQMDVLS